MLRTGLTSALVLAQAACGAGEPPPEGPAEARVLGYDYTFDLESREASARLTLRMTAPGNCLEVPFRAQALEDVRFDDEPIHEGSLEGGLLTACGRGWEEGEEAVLSAHMVVPEETWGDSQVGYSTSTDLEEAPFHYLVSWVGGCDRFGPCDTAPSRFARYRFTVTHPEGTRVLCPGTVTAGPTETSCEFDFEGGPTYSTFGLMASPSWEESDLGDWGGVRATLHDMPSSTISEAFDAELHASFFAWMEDRFGPYPYGDEIRFAVGPTYWNGFEHPGNIVLNDLLADVQSAYTDQLAHTTNHEIVHQWAGDQTTLAGTYDFVWKEAMAEYLTFVFEDEEIGQEVARDTLNYWQRASSFAEYYPVPMEQPALIDYYGDVYGPGPMILFRQIEALFERDAVLAALAELLGEERAIGVEEVQAALERSTGADLDAYFDAWVYGEGAPVRPQFSVSVAQEAADAPAEVTLRQVAPDDQLFGAAFAIALVGDGEGERHEVWFDLGPDGTRELTVSAEPGFAVTDHRFDVTGTVLATESGASARRAIGPAPRYLTRPWVAPPRPR